jgi:hypothetical protein
MEFPKERCLMVPRWPPNNPDLNPIKSICVVAKWWIEKVAPKMKEELEKVITAAWNELDPEGLSQLARASFSG